jgi:hypothetical protein
MQRWIVAGVVAVLLLCGMAVGGYFALRSYRLNLPSPVWVPLPHDPALSMAELDKVISTIKTRLADPALLAKASDDLDLAETWNLPSDEACAAEISKRIFVRTGEADTAMGKVPAILVGLNGKRKERQVTGKIAVRLMDDVAEILGIEPPRRDNR